MRLIPRTRLAELWKVPNTSELFKKLHGQRINKHLHYEESEVDRFMAECDQNFCPALTVAALREKRVKLIKPSNASRQLGNDTTVAQSVLNKPEVLFIKLSQKTHRICSISIQTTSHLLTSEDAAYDKNRLSAVFGVAIDRLSPAIKACGLSEARARNNRQYFALSRKRVVQFLADLSTIPVPPEDLLTQLESGAIEIVPPHLTMRTLGVTRSKLRGIFFANRLTGLRIPRRQDYQGILGIAEQSIQEYLRSK